MEEETEETITISRKKYNSLCEDSVFLNALEATGVDNWEGYGIAQDLLEEWNEES